MGLTREAFLESIARVTVLFRATETEAQQYAETIFEACGWMRQDRFEDVCKELVKVMPQGRRPVPGQFIGMYRKLADEWHWPEENTRKACSGCDGMGMVLGHYKDIRTGRELDAMKPCPVCRPTQPLNENLVEQTNFDRAMDTISLMTPRGARVTLERTERNNIRIPDAHLLAIITRAGGEDPPPPKVDETQKALADQLESGDPQLTNVQTVGEAFTLTETFQELAAQKRPPQEEPVPFMDDPMPAVPNYTPEELDRLNQQAEEEGIPF